MAQPSTRPGAEVAFAERFVAEAPDLGMVALLDELDQPGRPRVVVIEDAHWADEATLDLLMFLGRRMDHARALLNWSR